METKVILAYKNDYQEHFGDARYSQVNITYKKGYLIQTEFFGIPEFYSNNLQIRDHYSIEDVSIPYIDGGIIRCTKDGVFISPQPISAKSVLGALQIDHSQKFEVLLIDDLNSPMGTATVHFEYGQIHKKKDTLSWDVELVIDSWNSAWDMGMYDRIIYHNILTHNE